MIKSVEVERKTFPIMDKCLDGIIRAANGINEKEVCFKIFNSHRLESKAIFFNGPLGHSASDREVQVWFQPT
jgi:hypothetical protein